MRMFSERNIVTGTIDVVVYEQFGNQKHYLESVKGQELVWKSIDQGEAAECFMKLPFDFAEDFINHLVEAMGDAGIKTEPHSYYEGKLEGMEEHIKTLQKLLGLDHDDKVVSVTIERKDAIDGTVEGPDTTADGKKD